MKIYVNGEPREVRATALGQLLDELGLGEARVATALNEAFVPAPERARVPLAEGDRLEIVAPMQGG